jgi:hypothetical protein
VAVEKRFSGRFAQSKFIRKLLNIRSSKRRNSLNLLP